MRVIFNLCLDLLANFILISMATLCFMGGQFFSGMIVLALTTLLNAWIIKG